MQELIRLGEAAVTADSSAHRPLLLFSHANGYPPMAYRRLLTLLQQDFDVIAVEHRPFWQSGGPPRFLPWQVYANDLLSTLEKSGARPVWLVGHSMGAVTGMLAAQQAPERFNGIVALDPVLLPRALWLSAQALMRLFRRELPITRRALGRPHQFESFDAAFEFYRSKRPFAAIVDDVLWDYVESAHQAIASGGISLRWSGAWEACVYRSAPFMFDRLRTLNTPMLGIAGARSDVLNPVSLQAWQTAVPGLDLHVLEGGHLIPLENPEACARLIQDFIHRHDE